MQDPAFANQATNLSLNLAFQNSGDFTKFLADNFDSVTKTLIETKLLD